MTAVYRVYWVRLLRRLTKRWLNRVVDVIEATGVLTCSLILFPLLSVTKSPHRFWLAMRFLAPRAMFGFYLQARFKFRMGQTGDAIGSYYVIIKALDEEFDRVEILADPELKLFYQSLFRELMEMFIVVGDLDQAASVLIWTQNRIGVHSFPSHPQFTLEVAHILKAGIAAGRLLEDESLKGLFESGKSIIIKAAALDSEFLKSRSHPPSASTGDAISNHPVAKILPFRRPENRRPEQK